MRTSISAILICCAVLVRAPTARACGGFFCSRLPVDQTAERIVFRINPNSVTMIVQIAYAGPPADFAWVLPLANVPDPGSLGVFPQRALAALDANTGPTFQSPSECFDYDDDDSWWDGCGQNEGFAAAPSTAIGGLPSVTVHYRAEVGPYEVAAIQSLDPMALYDWLQQQGFNVNETMLPYIRIYTDEGSKFLALKLRSDQKTSDIQPFRFDLPGTTPSIPLRMTALAAEPEMSIVVFVIGDQRYGGANWPSIQIADDRIAWDMTGWPVRTNWAALVARAVDEAGGQGWVTELAGNTTPLLSLLRNSMLGSPDDMQAGDELLRLIGDAPYISRLYTRLSAEEMAFDPIFKRDPGGYVSSSHQLSRIVDGVDQCGKRRRTPDPCLFTSCGAGGICLPVMLEGASEPVAGCGCVDGATARTTRDPSTDLGASVVCQDWRMSFVNPGDVMPSGATMPDPCIGFDCGADGECVVVNMTPTCACDHEMVAVGSFAADGTRQTTCKRPAIAVPAGFYQQRLPDLPADLSGGRRSAVDPALPVVKPKVSEMAPSARHASGCQVGAIAARSTWGAAPFGALLVLRLASRRRTSVPANASVG
jgi:hypothetical protein